MFPGSMDYKFENQIFKELFNSFLHILSVKEKVFPTLALLFLVSPPEFSNKLKEKDNILTRKVDAYVAKISFQNSVVNH